MAIVILESEYNEYTEELYQKCDSTLKYLLHFHVKVCCAICKQEFLQGSQFERHANEIHQFEVLHASSLSIFYKLQKSKISKEAQNSAYKDVITRICEENTSPLRDLSFFKIKVCCGVCREEFEHEQDLKQHAQISHSVEIKLKEEALTQEKLETYEIKQGLEDDLQSNCSSLEEDALKFEIKEEKINMNCRCSYNNSVNYEQDKIFFIDVNCETHKIEELLSTRIGDKQLFQCECGICFYSEYNKSSFTAY